MQRGGSWDTEDYQTRRGTPNRQDVSKQRGKSSSEETEAMQEAEEKFQKNKDTRREPKINILQDLEVTLPP